MQIIKIGSHMFAKLQEVINWKTDLQNVKNEFARTPPPPTPLFIGKMCLLANYSVASWQLTSPYCTLHNEHIQMLQQAFVSRKQKRGIDS